MCENPESKILKLVFMTFLTAKICFWHPLSKEWSVRAFHICHQKKLSNVSLLQELSVLVCACGSINMPDMLGVSLWPEETGLIYCSGRLQSTENTPLDSIRGCQTSVVWQKPEAKTWALGLVYVLKYFIKVWLIQYYFYRSPCTIRPICVGFSTDLMLGMAPTSYSLTYFSCWFVCTHIYTIMRTIFWCESFFYFIASCQDLHEEQST